MTDTPTHPIDKELVAKRFSYSRSTYDREASVQRQVAEKMMRLLTDALLSAGIPRPQLPTHFRHIVELGCGTGSYSRMLLNFLPGDAEALDFPRETDLITSCSTLQWFNDPGAFLTRCHQALVADGLLAFSTFGTTNMHEIRQLTGHGLDYLSVEELQALLSPHFDILHAEEEVVTLPFPTPQAVLKHLKQTGVTGTEKRIWTRSRLQSFCKEYTTRFSDAAGNVNLTYHPIYIIARKKTK